MYEIVEDRRTGRSHLKVSVAGTGTSAEVPWCPVRGWHLSPPHCGAEFAAAAVAAANAAPLRMAQIPRLQLQGGPATGGARWVQHGVVPVCLATRRELVNALGRTEIPFVARRAAAEEILARPRDARADAADAVRRERDGRDLGVSISRSTGEGALDVVTRTPRWATCAEGAQRAVSAVDVRAAERLLDVAE